MKEKGEGEKQFNLYFYYKLQTKKDTSFKGLDFPSMESHSPNLWETTMGCFQAEWQLWLYSAARLTVKPDSFSQMNWVARDREDGSHKQAAGQQPTWSSLKSELGLELCQEKRLSS